MVKLICSRCALQMKTLDGNVKISQYKYSKKKIKTLGDKFVIRNHLTTKAVGYFCFKCWKIAKNVKVDYLGKESDENDLESYDLWSKNYEHKPTTVTFSGKDGKTRTVTATKIVPKKKVWTKQDAKKNREFYAKMFSKQPKDEETYY